MGLPYSSDGKGYDCTAGDPGSIPRSGTFLGEGNHNLLQYSCLENSMDRGAWWPTEGHNSDYHVLPTFLYGHCAITFLAVKCCYTGLGLSRAPWHPWSKRAHPQSRSSVHRAQRLCGLSRMSWPSLVPFSVALWSTLWTLWGNLLWVGEGQ